VLSKVIAEEKRQIEKEMRENIVQQGFERQANLVVKEADAEDPAAEESSDGEHGVEKYNKPVDRLAKKTKMQLNKKVSIFHLKLKSCLACSQRQNRTD
jgi:hypothetical protein